MNQLKLEPGLLGIFRLYITTRLVVIILLVVMFIATFGIPLTESLIPYAIIFVVDVTFLIVFLSWPGMQNYLRRAFLPSALAITAITTILEARYLNLYDFEGSPGLGLLESLFLTIPLILTAWQYSFLQVEMYAIGTAFVDFFVLYLRYEQTGQLVFLEGGVILGRGVFFLLIGYIVTHLMGEQRRQRTELSDANRKLIRYATTLEELTASRERNRLARELHDTLAHTLSGLTVQLDAIAAIWETNPRRASAMLDQALSTARMGLDETRRALQSLRATPLEDLGLCLAVSSLAESVAQRTGFQLKLDIDEGCNDHPPEIEQAFYRVAQEALENIAKHANAATVQVSLHRTTKELTLAIEDDGVGFSAEEIRSNDHYGVKGMEERAELIGAQFAMDSQPGLGTKVELVQGAPKT